MWFYYPQTQSLTQVMTRGVRMCVCACVWNSDLQRLYCWPPPLSLTRAAAAADVPVPCHRFSTRPCGNKKELLAFTRPMDLVPVS